MTDENIRFLITNYVYDRLGIGNILKSLISALGINDDTVIESYDDYIYGRYDTVLDKRFIYDATKIDKNIEVVYTCRLLVHKTEEDLQQDIPGESRYFGGLNNPRFNHFFSFSKLIDSNYDPDKIHPVVRDRIFKIIDSITFLPSITDAVSEIHDGFQSEKTLGVSIRTWKAVHERNIDRLYDSRVYLDRIAMILERHPEIEKAVISIDNESYLDDYLSFFENKRIPYLILDRPRDKNEIQTAVIKMLLLGKCDYFIGNRTSTFSELVFWFGKHHPRVYTVF